MLNASPWTFGLGAAKKAQAVIPNKKALVKAYLVY